MTTRSPARGSTPTRFSPASPSGRSGERASGEELRAALGVELTGAGVDPGQVIDELAAAADPG